MSGVSNKNLEVISMISMDVVEEAIDKWGFDAQLRMVQEECAELIAEINHFCRNSRQKKARESLIEETADVLIVLQNLFVLFNDMGELDTLKKYVDMKMKRVIERINKSS